MSRGRQQVVEIVRESAKGSARHRRFAVPPPHTGAARRRTPARPLHRAAPGLADEVRVPRRRTWVLHLGAVRVVRARRRPRARVTSPRARANRPGAPLAPEIAHREEDHGRDPAMGARRRPAPRVLDPDPRRPRAQERPGRELLQVARRQRRHHPHVDHQARLPRGSGDAREGGRRGHRTRRLPHRRADGRLPHARPRSRRAHRGAARHVRRRDAAHRRRADARPVPHAPERARRRRADGGDRARARRRGLDRGRHLDRLGRRPRHHRDPGREGPLAGGVLEAPGAVPRGARARGDPGARRGRARGGAPHRRSPARRRAGAPRADGGGGGPPRRRAAPRGRGARAQGSARAPRARRRARAPPRAGVGGPRPRPARAPDEARGRRARRGADPRLAERARRAERRAPDGGHAHRDLARGGARVPGLVRPRQRDRDRRRKPLRLPLGGPRSGHGRGAVARGGGAGAGGAGPARGGPPPGGGGGGGGAGRPLWGRGARHGGAKPA